MDSHSIDNPERLTAQTTRGTASSRPTAAPTAGISSILNNAQNNNINNNTFVTNIKAGTQPSLEVLYKRVAPNAILNTGGRADEVRCHPGTREEVIDRIEKWRNGQDGLSAPIFWLSGPAGAGKTAIVQTMAERWNEQKASQANFFFFRMDASRNSLFPIVATLLHQIILLYPPVEKAVAAVLSTNPLIFNSILEEQLTQLIVVPLRALQQSSASYRPLTLLIDGLDECDSESKRSQRQILCAFDHVLTEHPFLLRLLVASRSESQIQAAFKEISPSKVLPLYLDHKYSPERDIRLFVEDQFEHIRKTHPSAHTLDAAWPSVKDVDSIVGKSSGQFIYAATVLRFILNSSASPMLSLERAQGVAQIATKSPFSHLDALYTHILSQADDQEALKDILHAQLLIQVLRKRFLCETPCTKKHPFRRPCITPSNKHVELVEILQSRNPRYTALVVSSCLADLTSIAQYDGELLFYHASFSDYLLDRSRSGDYFINFDALSSENGTALLVKMQHHLVWHVTTKLDYKLVSDNRLLYLAAMWLYRGGYLEDAHHGTGIGWRIMVKVIPDAILRLGTLQ
ncbi:hypothetical protein D9619_000238 [Psilocybe cf. subviscida]|uniref:NACHT domain-containing protein n=1 Tax=Psilocybe cf. subviscida TaxID=2480587 RepID=A0A8H5BFJ0_9AGAR|nr:hypothetical protein D9619_000238 [Psilocybe cf. subviscida]